MHIYDHAYINKYMYSVKEEEKKEDVSSNIKVRKK